MVGPIADIGEAAFVCAWAEGCLMPDAINDAADPAPGRNTSTCVAAYLVEAVQGMVAAGADPRPFDVLGACAHVASDCSDYRSCLFDLGVLNTCPDTTQPGITCDGAIARLPCSDAFGISRAVDCAASGRTCTDGVGCVGASCTFGEPASCAPDGSFIVSCFVNNTEANLDCHGQTCALFATQGRCLPGVIGTCGADGASCDGDTQVLCAGGVESRVHCTAVDMVCPVTGCANPSPTCDPVAFQDSCAGDELTICASGAEHTFDCGTVGATCGTLTSGLAGCAFP